MFRVSPVVATCPATPLDFGNLKKKNMAWRFNSQTYHKKKPLGWAKEVRCWNSVEKSSRILSISVVQHQTVGISDTWFPSADWRSGCLPDCHQCQRFWRTVHLSCCLQGTEKSCPHLPKSAHNSEKNELMKSQKKYPLHKLSALSTNALLFVFCALTNY